MSRELHPVLAPGERNALVEEGIERFNAGRYFDAHESWEEVWRSTTPEPADLWRGLIQVAVGLYHHRVRGNPAAARRVLARGLRRVEAHPQGTEGLDLDALVEAGHRWEAWLAEAEAGERRGEPPPPRLQRLS